MKMLSINTVLTAFAVLLMAVIGFLCTEIYKKVYATTEAVAVIQATMVSRIEFEQFKVKLLEIQQKQDSMSLEIRRMKQHP